MRLWMQQVDNRPTALLADLDSTCLMRHLRLLASQNVAEGQEGCYDLPTLDVLLHTADAM
jgi:hypothetical protein